MTSNGTVFVVDDDAAVRNALCALLEAVGLPAKAYADAAAFLDDLDTLRSGCLVLDIRMPGMSGIELQRKLVSEGIDIPVIIITGHGDIQAAVDTMKNGALDFIQKPYDPSFLLERVRQALALSSQRLQEETRKREVAERLATLTRRELQVLRLLAAGHSSKEAGEQLGISSKTVDGHRLHLMLKLQVNSVVELALTGQALGVCGESLPP